ncbi:hypothetical protein MKI84_20035 [Ancylobacter sp. A5.8]|uniref:hypothetical protein n=1 Tax=Ancylobacter gelatini TaxID=2919920 RepID=UPI001F4ED0E6|nr:hypothetical protein [Ancylobacter gelatini]MCJ8145218.1 hypothetical protein [Ancylobacter gelatini]
MNYQGDEVMAVRTTDVAPALRPPGPPVTGNAFPGAGVGAFWARGALSPLDQACLLSFLRRGIKLTLFSYAPLENVPKGIEVADAAAIVPESLGQRIIYNGRPDICHFSDFFRYEMIRQRNLTWVDTDVLMIADGDFSGHKNLLISEEPHGLNNAIIYISDHAFLDHLREEIYDLFDKELRWGETGPNLIKKVNNHLKKPIETTNHSYFYPIGYHDIWKILLPEYFDFCSSRCTNASTLHIFNNILTKIGYWKQMLPPDGSYLHHVLKENNSLSLFKETYPEDVMRAIVFNFIYRQNGKALGIKSIIREFVPSMIRTYRTYYKSR